MTVKAVAFKVVEKEILNEDKTLKQAVTRIVGYFPMLIGPSPHFPGSTFDTVIGSALSWDCSRDFRINSQLFPTPEEAMAFYEANRK